MSSKSPLVRVNDEFGGKDKLVDRIVGLIPAGDEPKEELRKRLLGAANRKLIRLLGVAGTVKDKFGSRDKLVDATAAAVGRTKDQDYVEKMGGFSTGRLLDIYRSAERRKNREKPAVAAAAPAAGAPAAPEPAPRPKAGARAESKPAMKAKAGSRAAARPKAERKSKAKAAAKKSKK